MVRPEDLFFAIYNIDVALLKPFVIQEDIDEFWIDLNNSLGNIFSVKPTIRKVPSQKIFADVPFLRIKDGPYRLDISRSSFDFTYSAQKRIKYNDIFLDLKKLSENLNSFIDNRNFIRSGVQLGISLFYPQADYIKSLEKLLSNNINYYHGRQTIHDIDISFLTKFSFKNVDIHNHSRITIGKAPYGDKGVLISRKIHTIKDEAFVLNLSEYIQTFEKNLNIKKFTDIIWGA